MSLSKTILGAVLWASLAAAALLVGLPPTRSSASDENGPNTLSIVRGGRTETQIIVSPRAGQYERLAADDLARYVEKMSGAHPAVVSDAAAATAAFASSKPLLIIGQAALDLRPDLRNRLASIAKQKPYLRADAIVLLREGTRVFLAGSNDEAHYFAVAELLKRWGMRWYMPGAFGECVPSRPDLSINNLDYAYAPPFEVRTYWLSWLGDPQGQREFQLRNGLDDPRLVPPASHALGQYTKGLGAGRFDVPLTAPATADQVAKGVEPLFAKGTDFSLAMEDGLYASNYPRDVELSHLRWDPSMLRWSISDPMLELYQNVLLRLRQSHPNSTSKVGFLAYSNMTLPPVRAMTLDPALFAELAPIDIDPNHGMDDPRSPQKQGLLGILNGWAAVMAKRVIIYDYDQGMLVWRDLPNPSQAAFKQDVKHYQAAGILGVNTESRGALATTFLNLFLRAQLLWNPDVNVDALLSEFYPNFYGPAATPMRHYWEAIFAAWSNTAVTEHEYFAVPAIYTRDLVDRLRRDIDAAELLIHPLQERSGTLSPNEKLYIERMRFTRLSFEVIDAYTAMVERAASQGEFAAAVDIGTRGLGARDALTAMSKTFTSTQMEDGPAWWAGEVHQYAELAALTSGPKGRLVKLLPSAWPARRDPDRHGLERGFAVEPIDLGFWQTEGHNMTFTAKHSYPDHWEVLRADLYAGAQGVEKPSGEGYLGDLWYRLDLDLTAEQASDKLHLMFPGVFGACLLFLDGVEIARRTQDPLWWNNDYKFEWDVNLSGRVRPGFNGLALDCDSEGHFAGMFRRPFLYSPSQPQ